jgi:type IV pilus assembly protein PilQ
VLSLGAGGGDAAGGIAQFATAEESGKPPTPDEVVELLQSSVTPQAWTDERNGITVRGNTLYITAPPDTHRLLSEFIRAQEATANLMVQVDTRWLTINDDFMEEIGVDWKVGSMLAFPGVASGITRQNNNSTFFGSTNNVLPATAVTQSPSLQSTGLQLEFGLIGPTQLSAILYAAERNKRGRVLAAPSVTTLNGVRANVFVGEEIAYISDYEIVSSTFDPVIKVIPVGVSLDIKPFVSADRKYVTMDFQPAQTSIQIFTDFIIAPQLNNNGTFQDGVDLPQAIGGLVSYPIELPNVTIREAGTTLTIPDRASALIGGFNKSIDQTAEARVPFLGDIPYLGRLFGHRGRYSEREKRYLMATVTIISNDEQEAKL